MLSRKALLSESGFGSATLAKEVMSKNVVSVDYNDDVEWHVPQCLKIR
jgi:hypothetical protein